jgi:hypothetical protein
VRVTGTSTVQFDFARILQYFAVNKDAFPSNPARPAGCAKSFSLPKQQAQVFHVKYQAQYQAFVRFWSATAQLSKAIALNWTCVLEPFNRGRALALRPLAFTRTIPRGIRRGQQTLDRRYVRNVVGPAGYSK